MERNATLEEAMKIMGKNFIGKGELETINTILPLNVPKILPEINYSIEFLEKINEEYILLYGASHTSSKIPVNLLYLREIFGVNFMSEPCFYNQDWYMKEVFMKETLKNKWYLLRKEVFEDSRAVLPSSLSSKYSFPSAILCAFAFFVFWLCRQEVLWRSDFVWCSDLDHNGDRIYVGKYNDMEQMNNNGFSIHRFLTLKKCYGSISSL